MKKLTVILLAMLMIACAVIPAAAVTFKTAAPTDVGTLILKKGPTSKEMTEYSGTFSNLKENGTSFCNKKDSVARYEFSVEKAGTYTFVIEYIARPDKARYVNYAIDDKAKAVRIDLEENAEKRYALITAELKAGKHNFYIMAPTDFDDSKIKSCDIYGWSLYLTKEAAATTKATTKAPAATPASPATFDAAIILAAVVSAAGAGAVVLKKKH